jgi:hypothetical protein
MSLEDDVNKFFIIYLPFLYLCSSHLVKRLVRSSTLLYHFIEEKSRDVGSNYIHVPFSEGRKVCIAAERVKSIPSLLTITRDDLIKSHADFCCSVN